MWKCLKCAESIKDTFEVCWSCGTTKEGILDPHFLDPEAGSAAPENEAMEYFADDGEENLERMATVAQCKFSAEAHAMRVQLEAPTMTIGRNSPPWRSTTWGAAKSPTTSGDKPHRAPAA
jgi:hypothetical protein